jgi:hypothetical protein
MRPYILFAVLLAAIVPVSHPKGAQAQGLDLDTAAIEQATWGKGKAVDLAQSLKRVLDAQAAVKS